MHPVLLPSWLGRVILVVVWLANAAGAQTLPDPKPMITDVLATHPAVRQAQFQVEAAEHTLGGSRVQPNPTLTLAATAGDASENSNYIAQTFEISGQPRLRYEQAQARLEAARLQLRQARRVVAGEVYGAWLGLWESQHLAMMAQLRMDLMQEMSRVTRRRFEVGEIPQNESLRVELAAAEAEADLKKAQAAYASAARSLAILRGLTSPEETATPPLPEVTAKNVGEVFDGPRLSPEQPWSLEQALASADGQLEVEALRQEQRASVLAAELLAKERAPQLGVSVYRSQFFGSAIEQGAQVYISWPIFDWGSISSRKKAQLSLAQAQMAEAEDKALDYRREVAETWNQWQAAVSVREILQAQAERYEELARESRVGYDLGMLTLTDVLQTESAFRQAGVQLIQANAQIHRLELSLLERTNLPWPTDLLEE